MEEKIPVPSPSCRPTALPPPVRAMLEEEQRESALFLRTMRLARDKATPFEELYNRPPPAPEDESMGGGPHAVHQEVDRLGNPRWISLTLPERGGYEESLGPKSVLPSGDDSAAAPFARELPRQGKTLEKKARLATTPARGALSSLWERLYGKSREPDSFSPEARALREREGKGFLTPRKARPMRSFFRMLLVTAILGMLYHILSRKGWVPPLF